MPKLIVDTLDVLSQDNLTVAQFESFLLQVLMAQRRSVGSDSEVEAFVRNNGLPQASKQYEAM